MTSHEAALEAACAAVILGRDRDDIPVHLSQAEAERAISVYISTLSPDVSDMEERLRYVVDEQMAPPGLTVFFREAADALASLSAQLAVKDSALRLANEQWESAIETLRKSKGRAETAEASLSAAQEENERLRKALADMLPPKLDWREADADGYYVHHKASAIRDARAALSTPSKEDKTDAE